MAHQSVSGTTQYVVYMPYNESALAIPVRVDVGAYVEDLRIAICEHHTFKHRVRSEAIYLYACVELPNGGDKAKRYEAAIMWLEHNRDVKEMEPSDFLAEYDQIPAPVDAKAIDVIVATNSILQRLSAKGHHPNPTLPFTAPKRLSDLITFACGGDVGLTATGVRGHVLNQLDAFWRKVVRNSACNYKKPIPFPVVISLPTETYRWSPRPDVTFLERNIPRFLVQFDSPDREQGESRFIVYASCMFRLLARLKGVGRPRKGEDPASEGNVGSSKGTRVPSKEENFLNDEADKSVILMGAYFSDSWQLVRYFFFVNEENDVGYEPETFNMKDPIQFSQFLLEFYNYTLNVALVSNKSNVVPDMAAISKQIAEGIQKSFHTEGISKDGEEAKSGSSQHHYDTRPITEQYDAAEIRAAIVNGLRRTQYQVDEDDEFRPFIDLPDHVMEATGPNHQKLIVKLVRKSSNERAFLEELSKQKSPLNHIVPLLATFPSRLGTLLIVERGNSLQVFAGGKADVNTAERWSRELIEAVAFLHQQNIAHLDIKPGNIICTLRGHKLLLIDFDIAMRCKSADETIKKSCGTVGWSAPEIVIEDGKPLQAFSPIRADLWSTGKVLQLITDMCDRSAFKPLMEMLLDLDPKRRPLLHEVVDEESVSWPTTQLAQAFERYRIDVGN